MQKMLLFSPYSDTASVHDAKLKGASRELASEFLLSKKSAAMTTQVFYPVYWEVRLLGIPESGKLAIDSDSSSDDDLLDSFEGMVKMKGAANLDKSMDDGDGEA